ncbi:TetR/AcrR family transcriptional regulator [Flexilinea flocculi]|jgi:AcrR family transcriptional regulator|uniref:Transcriptional regulator, TetR family n=1 Tax=Flexilinea flocculi TaxID=1678840 RepID=A0A0S7BJ43_9CHLR|nr:TetR/AcrR family transcriptional regulator [Flexilinea flocculi]GAP40349.1 transcriptional regulator, TetR family [Flexilinea flocculi]
MMIEKKTDRRIKITKMLLRQSLLELMKEKPINKITITEICSHADINRNTFYTYYSTPDELLHQIENDLYDEIRHSVESSLQISTVSSSLLEIFTAISKNEDLCKILFSEFGDKVFLRKIMDIAYDRCITEWSEIAPDLPKRQLDLVYTFIANGCAGIIESWIQSGFKESPEEIAQIINTISSNGLQTFLMK